MIKQKWSLAVVVCWWVAVACLLSGCQLPDAGPFVDGTAQLKGAVAAGGAAVEQEVRYTFADTARADKLHQNWDARNQTMTALLRYAQSLDAIIGAGNKGAESAGKVADSVKGLAEAAGIAIPGSAEAVAVATDTVKFLYGQIAKVKAAGQLAAALDAAQPAVERIAQLMRKDFDDLTVITEAAVTIQAANLAVDQNKLNSDRKSLLNALKNLDPADATKREEYTAVTKLLAEVQTRYAVYQANMASVETRLRAARALIDASGRALDEWSAAHAALAAAARRKGQVNTQSLVAAVVELRDLVKRMREL